MPPHSAKKLPKPAATPASPTKKRTFKSKWFAKAAKARGISDKELCQVIAAVMAGRADDLGGGVWKKRLNANMDRSIIVAKGGMRWFFVYLFQKADRDNIDADELSGFKDLAKVYAGTSDENIERALEAGELVEICT